MTDALLVLAVLCGGVAALRGNATAWALLASMAFTSVLIWSGEPFNLGLWMTIDLLVIAAIAAKALPGGPQMTLTDILVVALFIPAWGAYVNIGDPAAPAALDVIVALQLLLTPSYRECWHALGRRRAKRRHRDDNLQMAHA